MLVDGRIQHTQQIFKKSKKSNKITTSRNDAPRLGISLMTITSWNIDMLILGWIQRANTFKKCLKKNERLTRYSEWCTPVCEYLCYVKHLLKHCHANCRTIPKCIIYSVWKKNLVALNDSHPHAQQIFF